MGGRAITSTARRVTLALMVVAGLGLILEICAVLIHYGGDRDYLDRAKTDQEVEAIADALVVGDDGKIKVDLPAHIAARYRDFPAAYAYQIVDADGTAIVGANEFAFPSEPGMRDLRADYFMSCVQHGQDRLCVSSRRLDVADRQVWVRVAVVGDPAGIVLGVFMRELIDDVWIPIIPVLLAMLLVNVFLVRRALRPLDRAAEEARRLDPAHEHTRLSEDGLPSEVLALVHAINDMLARTERILAAQREFTANAAHELRTPIAVLMLRLGELEGDVAARLRADLKAMARQIDQLLEMTKVDAMIIGPNDRVDLAAVARDTVETLAILALDRGCELAFEDEGGATIAGNSDAVQFALRNLIDNAIRHSPPGETVRVIAGPGAQLQVVDRGKGIPRHMRDRIFQRFWRGSHSEGAAGLGLAIVKHVADAHGASIAIDDAAGGGTHIRLIFGAAANAGIGIKTQPATPAELASGNPTLASG